MSPATERRRLRARRRPSLAVDTLSRARGTAAAIVVACGPLTVALTYGLFGSALPPELVLLRRNGVAELEAPTLAVVTGCVLLGLVCVLLAASTAAAGPRWGFRAQRAVVVGLATCSGLVSGIWWTLMAIVLAARAGADPSAGPVGPLTWLVVWMLLLGIAGALACGRPRPVATGVRPHPDLPRVELPEGDRARWQVRSQLGLFTLGGVALAVTGSSVWTTSGGVAVACWVIAALSLLMGSLTVRVDRRGVTLAPWGLPVPVTLPYDIVVEARPATVSPGGWNGAGHRVVNARTGLVPRRGPGVTLMLADGRSLSLALDQAEVVAGIVNAHLDRLRDDAYDGPLRRSEDRLEPAPIGPSVIGPSVTGQAPS